MGWAVSATLYLDGEHKHCWWGGEDWMSRRDQAFTFRTQKEAKQFARDHASLGLHRGQGYRFAQVLK